MFTKLSPLLKRILFGTMWLTLGSVIARGLVLIGMLFVVRFLGPEQYGQFAILQTTVLAVVVFAGLGLGSTVTRHVALLKNNNPAHLAGLLKLTNRLALLGSFGVASLLFFGADFVAQNVLNLPQLGTFLKIAAAAIIFSMLFGYFNSTLVGFEAVKESAATQVIGTTIAIPILLILTFQFGLIGAVWGLVALGLAQMIPSWFFYKRVFKKWNLEHSASIGRNEWFVVRDYTVPAFFTGIIVMPTHWVCQAILINAPNGTIEMATVGILMQWFFALLFLPAIAGRIFLPILSEMHANQDQSQSQKVLFISIGMNSLVVFPAALVLGLCSPWILSTYGSAYTSEWLAFVYIMLAAAFSVLSVSIGQSIVAMGRMWLTASLNLSWAVLFISLTWFWVDRGADGLARALLISYIMLFIGSWLVLFRRPQINKKLREATK